MHSIMKAVASLAVLLGLTLFISTAASAAQPVGSALWAVLKCKYSDTPEVPATADTTLDNLFNGAEGVRQYFAEISHGKYRPLFRISGIWRTMGVSIAQDRKEGFNRYRRTEECIKVSGVRPGMYAGIIVNFNVDIDAGYAGNVLLTPGAWATAFAAHEMLHHLGLNHSFDTSTRKNSTWSAPGEYYDHWDIMSAMAIYGFKNANGLTSGPDLALPFKLSLGWIAAQKDVTLIDARVATGVSMGETRDLSLRPYSSVSGSMPLGACVDVGAKNGEFTRYCAEYRQKSGWDRVIPEGGVLIHSLKNNSLENQQMTVVRDRIFRAGETFKTPDGGATFVINEITDKSARLRIEY